MDRMDTLQHWFGGEAHPSADGRSLPTYDPLHAEPWANIARGSAADVAAAVRSARGAFRSWRNTTPSKRAEVLWRLADEIAADAEELALLESKETGKVIREMRAQLRSMPQWWRYASALTQRLEGRVVPSDNPTILNYTRREPYGVVGVIVPFNSPILITTLAAAPALAAGNTVVVKPSEHASAGILRMAQLFERAGFPPGCFNVITGYGDEAGLPLASHPDIDKIVFTGGVDTGRKISIAAADYLRPTLMELGGKSAQIVFPDAPTSSVVNGVLAGIFAAAGQTCIAGSRLLVHEECAEEIIAGLASRAKTIKMGDPLHDDTEIGPMAVQRIRDGVRDRVERAVAGGARVLAGGEMPTPDGYQGWFYSPTVIDGVRNEQEICQEELFGPVLTVQRFSTEEEAVGIANDSPFGLAAGVWTKDVSRAHRLATELNVGTVWINTYRSIAYSSPFGGRGLSGHGREMGIEGLDEFCTTKSVWVETSDQPVSDPFAMRV